jgi:hypothetical protein
MKRQKYPYARWANERIKQITDEGARKEARDTYFSNSGKLIKFDNYRQFCKEMKVEPDPAPDGYWESKVTLGHNIAGILGVLMIGFLYLIGGTAKGSMLPRRY